MTFIEAVEWVAQVVLAARALLLAFLLLAFLLLAFLTRLHAAHPCVVQCLMAVSCYIFMVARLIAPKVHGSALEFKVLA